MSELLDSIKRDLQDFESRHIYADDLLNSYIATQIKVLREQKGWTQRQLAEAVGMKQERISVLEDVNYESWTAKILKRLALAFDLRLSIKFEEFGTFIEDFQGIKRASLTRRPFNEDPAFSSSGDNEAESGDSRTVLEFPIRTEIEINVGGARDEQLLPFMFPYGLSRPKTRKRPTETAVVTSSAGADNSYLNDETGGRIYVNQR